MEPAFLINPEEKFYCKMNKDYELKYHRIEENYWWFVAHRDMFLRYLVKFKINRNSKILDIGCSGGHLIKLLQENGYKNTCGIDISERAINLCKRKGIKNVFVMDSAATNFDDRAFDIIIAADVLEHIKDGAKALAEWNRIMKPGGRIILSVPAFDFLWSRHDELNKHYRRYNKPDLADALEKSKFKVIRASYWNFSLFFPAAAFACLRRICRTKPINDNLYDFGPIANKLLLLLLRSENLIMEYLGFPFGTSIFALAVKPE